MTAFELLISREEIKKKVIAAAQEIDRDYNGEEVVIVMIMKGSFILVADLVRELQIPCRIEYIKASSYGSHGSKRGDLTLLGLDQIDISHKNVLVVDDVFDSGETFSQVMEELKKKNPKKLKSLVLLHKKRSRSIVYEPDYVLFEIEDRFVVGYGLDYKENYRQFPDIHVVTIKERAE